MRVTQSLWFASGMDAALALYTSLIPGSAVEKVTSIQAETPSGPPGSVRVATFRLGDQRYQALEAGPLDPFNHAFSVSLECDTQAEIDRLWAALGEGGQVEQCGWLRDRWGLCWQIVPKRLNELMSDADPEVVKRVTAAMLGMVKLDIAGLEAAARG